MVINLDKHAMKRLNHYVWVPRIHVCKLMTNAWVAQALHNIGNQLIPHSHAEFGAKEKPSNIKLILTIRSALL